MIKIWTITALCATAVWSIEVRTDRNPFVVSKEYMNHTGKHYLIPQNISSDLKIDLKGIVFRKGAHKAWLDLGDEGMLYVQEKEKVSVDTEDLKTTLYIQKIDRNFVKISINGGEAIRYDIK
jgi:hypothetical protein